MSQPSRPSTPKTAATASNDNCTNVLGMARSLPRYLTLLRDFIPCLTTPLLPHSAALRGPRGGDWLCGWDHQLLGTAGFCLPTVCAPGGLSPVARARRPAAPARAPRDRTVMPRNPAALRSGDGARLHHPRRGGAGTRKRRQHQASNLAPPNI